MLIAQITDTHIAGWGKKTFGVAPMAENLARCVAHINRLTPQPDVVLVTGDISNNGLRQELERAASILDNLHAPYYVIPGNHDDRAALASVFGHRACPTESENFINYVIEGYDIRLITVDSTIPNAPGGELDRSRLSWLEMQLEQDETRPTILFMHHPPVAFGVPETDIDGFIGTEALGDVIEKHDNIERILCGHIHLSALTQWRGVVVSAAPSIGMRLTIDLTLQQPSRYILEEPSYQLHYWSPEKNLITYTIIARDAEVTHPFDDSEMTQ